MRQLVKQFTIMTSETIRNQISAEGENANHLHMVQHEFFSSNKMHLLCLNVHM